jgi:hypothetical protein
MSWSRRHFLSAGAAAALVTIKPAPAEVIAVNQRQAFLLVMDAIIPAGDGMPSASEAGGLAYLEQLARNEPEIGKQLGQSLRTLEALSERRFELGFTELGEKDRSLVLEELERDAPPQFNLLRDTVYESYYTQAAIWKLIGYVPYPTDHQGPHLKAFDETLLADVRNRPKLYREA